MENTNNPLSNVQLELLKLFALDVPEEDLLNIKQILLKYQAERLMDMADQAWEDQRWSDAKVHDFLATHMRTPYRPSAK
ncbi:MAG: hypothetical protein AAF399_04140 [Bacteroidota bacterium]